MFSRWTLRRGLFGIGREGGGEEKNVRTESRARQTGEQTCARNDVGIPAPRPFRDKNSRTGRSSGRSRGFPPRIEQRQLAREKVQGRDSSLNTARRYSRERVSRIPSATLERIFPVGGQDPARIPFVLARRACSPLSPGVKVRPRARVPRCLLATRHVVRENIGETSTAGSKVTAIERVRVIPRNFGVNFETFLARMELSQIVTSNRRRPNGNEKRTCARARGAISPD